MIKLSRLSANRSVYLLNVQSRPNKANDRNNDDVFSLGLRKDVAFAFFANSHRICENKSDLRENCGKGQKVSLLRKMPILRETARALYCDFL